MAWDADGTVALSQNPSANTGSPVDPWSNVSAGNRAEMNDEDNVDAVTVGQKNSGWLCLIFPELREIDGIFQASAGGEFTSGSSKAESSADSTNGFDGTWSVAVASGSFIVHGANSVFPTSYRTSITSLAINAHRALRTKIRSGIGNTFHRGLHVYGTISPSETPDRLLWLDEDTGLEFTAPLDYGDVPRGSARDYQVRLRNNSATLTATTIQYTAESLAFGSAAWYTFTLPGGSTFQSTRQIASLGPEANTGIITVRQVVPDAAPLGAHVARGYTDVTTWS